jgi:epoxyqueuosine reductase
MTTADRTQGVGEKPRSSSRPAAACRTRNQGGTERSKLIANGFVTLLTAANHKEHLMDLTYKYKTVSVEHLKELQEDINELDRQGKLIDNERYRGYVSPDRFTLPENFLDARFIVILAHFTPLMIVDFLLNNKKYEAMLPPECYYSGMTNDTWIKLIEEEIIKQPGYRIEAIEPIPLKRLAVRSGLGRYGRNNICYVDEMGSFVTLCGFLTDFEFAEDNWQEVTMMDDCGSCRICMLECPCDCIREENFVIDAPKCISWYNERNGEFPGWMDPDIHNALLGCMKCQMSCPANDRAMEFTGRFEDIPQEDTKNILSGTIDEAALEAISKIFGPFTENELEDFTPILKRNLSVLIK